jgi:mono/diheme cytochrome c family protein
MKRWRAVWKLWIAIAGLVLVLAACGDRGDDESGDDPSLSRGRELYEENCESCHGGESGGEISDSPPPHNINGHTWHHPDCQLTEITLKGPTAWGGAVTPASMPAFEGRLSEVDVAAILAYIKIWWTDEQREYQEEVTAAECG